MVSLVSCSPCYYLLIIRKPYIRPPLPISLNCNIYQSFDGLNDERFLYTSAFLAAEIALEMKVLF